MSNSYSEMSMSVNQLTPKEFAWFERAAQLHYDAQEDRTHQAELLEMLDLEEIPNPDFCWPPFAIDLQPSALNNRVLIHQSEAVSVDALIWLLKAFLRRFRPDDRLLFELAYTSDEPRPGAFGGLGCVITAEGCYCVGSWDAMDVWQMHRALVRTDGLQLYLIVHQYPCGRDYFPVWHARYPSDEEAVAVVNALAIDGFKPGREGEWVSVVTLGQSVPTLEEVLTDARDHEA